MNECGSIDYANVITIWPVSPQMYGHKIDRRRSNIYRAKRKQSSHPAAIMTPIVCLF